MRSTFLLCGTLLSLSLVSAKPVLKARQEGDNQTTTTVDNGDGGGISTTVNDDTPGSSTTTPPGSSPSPPSTNPGSEDDCPPCVAGEGYRTRPSPSGRQCYCLADGSTEPWEWSDKTCINDGVGLPNDEGRPYFCLGSGSNPNSRACLSQCNFMLNTVNSANPCNPNLYNAARTCATCVPGGAIHYQLDGRSPGGPYYSGEGAANTFMEGLKNWCARPSTCIELTSGARISGTGGCPVVAQNSPVSPSGRSSVLRSGSSTTARAGTTGDSTVVRGGSTIVEGGTPASDGTVPSKIVTTNTISMTDAEGRPTFSFELATVDNPAFTGNTGFAGARPTTNSEGGATSGMTASFSTVLASLALTVMLFA